MPWKIAALAGVLLGLCVALLVFTMEDGGGQSESPAPALAADGKPLFARSDEAREVPRDAFRDGKGAEIRFADFKGRPLLVNFWATWCAPCVNELPSLARLAAASGPDDPLVIAVSLDREGGRPIPDFLKEVGAGALEPYTDPAKALMRGFRIAGLPTTVLIGADGTEIARHEGEAEWDSPAVRAAIGKALKEAAAD